MNLDELEFLPLKVVRVGPKGKRTFDPHGKRKLIELCRRPGASVASMALKAGVNANQLRNWMTLDETRRAATATISAKSTVPTAFVPVVEVTAAVASHERAGRTAPPPSPRLAAQLPNGVTVELHCTAGDTDMVAAMIKALGAY